MKTTRRETKNYIAYFKHSDNDSISYHREDGPALEYKDGCNTFWAIDGVFHREDGPATYYRNDSYYQIMWYYMGTRFNTLEWFIDCENDLNNFIIKFGKINNEFLRYVKLKAFI